MFRKPKHVEEVERKFRTSSVASTSSAPTSGATAITEFDARAIYEARNRREAMRATGAAVQPVISISNAARGLEDDRHARGSRLVREDENDASSEEEADAMRQPRAAIRSSANLLRDDELRRRDEQLEALRMEQGGSDNASDDDIVEIDAGGKARPSGGRTQRVAATSNGRARNGHSEVVVSSDSPASSDDSDDPWEREQIRRAVNTRKITELKQEIGAHRAAFYDQRGPPISYDASATLTATAASTTADRIVDEDMDIEVESPTGTKLPSFVNADGSLRRARGAHRYTRLAELVEKLQLGAERRREAIAAKRHNAEQNAAHIDENHAAIRSCAEANERMERAFLLYQEMRFFTTNVLNCLDEKVPLINAIDATSMAAWRTRADDLARRRAERHARRRYERARPFADDGWDSDVEEATTLDAHKEAMDNVRERASHVFDDTAVDYCDVGAIVRRFLDWKANEERSFQETYAGEFIPKLIGPFVRHQLLAWNPLLPRNATLTSMEWYRAILRLGMHNEGFDADDSLIVDLIPHIIEKIILPKVTVLVKEQWNPLSRTQTRRLVELVDHFARHNANLTRKSRFFRRLLSTMRERDHGHDSLRQ